MALISIGGGRGKLAPVPTIVRHLDAVVALYDYEYHDTESSCTHVVEAFDHIDPEITWYTASFHATQLFSVLTLTSRRPRKLLMRISVPLVSLADSMTFVRTFSLFAPLVSPSESREHRQGSQRAV